MTTAVKAVYENGVFKPKEPVNLQEKTEVEVRVRSDWPLDESRDARTLKRREVLAGEKPNKICCREDRLSVYPLQPRPLLRRRLMSRALDTHTFLRAAILARAER